MQISSHKSECYVKAINKLCLLILNCCKYAASVSNRYSIMYDEAKKAIIEYDEIVDARNAYLLAVEFDLPWLIISLSEKLCNYEELLSKMDKDENFQHQAIDWYLTNSHIILDPNSPYMWKEFKIMKMFSKYNYLYKAIAEKYPKFCMLLPNPPFNMAMEVIRNLHSVKIQQRAIQYYRLQYKEQEESQYIDQLWSINKISQSISKKDTSFLAVKPFENIVESYSQMLPNISDADLTIAAKFIIAMMYNYTKAYFLDEDSYGKSVLVIKLLQDIYKRVPLQDVSLEEVNSWSDEERRKYCAETMLHAVLSDIRRLNPEIHATLISDLMQDVFIQIFEKDRDMIRIIARAT